MLPQCLLTLLACLLPVQAVTIYNQAGGYIPNPTGTVVSVAAPAQYTNDPAFNSIVLTAPPVPNPPPPTQFNIPLSQSSADVVGLSIPQHGSFFGFSVEFSVVTQVVGKNSSLLSVPFLNLMSLLAQRAGHVPIRVGGNSQETAALVDSLPNGAIMSKDKGQSTNPTETPTLTFTPDVIYMLGNVSALVNVKWYLGIPMNDTTNLRLQIAEVGEAVLGDNLLGFQLGNEPDLYSAHLHRPPTYSVTDYFNEFGVVVNGINNDPNIPFRGNLIAPSVASHPWRPEDVWDTGFIPAYTNALGALAVEHYPDDNCAAAFPQAGFGPPKDPQTVFPNYLNHNSGINIVKPYLNSTLIAQQAGKPFLMFETNTASCGGFPGVSDSFGAALWALDYGLQMAYSNFSQALLHVGGTDDTYNPFTPAPTNISTTHGWSIGPIFYSTLAIAETLGTTNTSQVIDLQANGGNIYTPGYAIYENGNLARVALFNFVTDPTGASTYTATISVGTVPAQVTVKYLLADTVAEKFNITWAGQTLGGQLASTGVFQGAEQSTTVNCDQTANTCNVQVPAPAYALVFFNQDPLQQSSSPGQQTFQTTAVTRTHNTVTVDPSVLATSNGQSSGDRLMGSTSQGSDNDGRKAVMVPTIAMAVLMTVLAGGVGLLVER